MSEPVKRKHIVSCRSYLNHAMRCGLNNDGETSGGDYLECDSYCSCVSDAEPPGKETPSVTADITKVLGEAAQAIKDGVCNVKDNILKTAAEIFSPLVMLINSIQGKEKKTVEDLDKVLEAIEKNDSLSKLSKESRAAFKKLVKTVDELSKDERYKHMDIRELIEKWRKTGDHNVLLQMAEKLKNNECPPFLNKNYKQALIEGLESLGNALAEVRQHPQSEDRNRTESELQQAADCHVSNVGKHIEKGGDANFTEEDKREVAANFKEARKHVRIVLNDPSLARFVENSSSALYHWIATLHDLLESWHMEDEEEKKAQEKKCEERCEMRKKFFELKAKADYARRKKLEFYDYIEWLKRKIVLNFLDKFNKDKAKADIAYANDKYNSASAMVSKYKHDTCEIIDSIPPPSVCGENLNMDLDLIC